LGWRRKSKTIRRKKSPSRGSGIGAFYDEEMRRHLDFSVARDLILRQIVIASPVSDPRLRA